MTISACATATACRWSGTCAPGEDFGFGGVAIDGVPPQEDDSEARLDGRTLPCAAALPVLCGAP